MSASWVFALTLLLDLEWQWQWQERVQEEGRGKWYEGGGKSLKPQGFVGHVAAECFADVNTFCLKMRLFRREGVTFKQFDKSYHL